MESIAYPYIVIEGVIGAGKSTLTKLLTQKLNAEGVYEEFEDNPFLPLFYKDPSRYAFQVELSFLAARYHQLSKKLNQPSLFHNLQIADYWFDKCMLFARNNLSKPEFDLFMNLFGIINSQLRQPDLILYLHLPVEVALERIASRGRTYEQDIKADYLEALSSKYLAHLKSKANSKVLILETEPLDFVSNEAHIQLVLDLLHQNHKTGISRITF